MEDIQADTNILLRSAEPAHPSHQKAVESVKNFLANGDRVYLIPRGSHRILERRHAPRRQKRFRLVARQNRCRNFPSRIFINCPARHPSDLS